MKTITSNSSARIKFWSLPLAITGYLALLLEIILAKKKKGKGPACNYFGPHGNFSTTRSGPADVSEDGCNLFDLTEQATFHLLGLVVSDEHTVLCFASGHVEGKGVLLADVLHELDGGGELVQHALWCVSPDEDRQVVHECGIEERREVLVLLASADTLVRRGRGAGDAMLSWPLLQ